jgi:hypothetical protein
MKKPFSFTERSVDVFCANPKCSNVRGAEGVTRAAIKKNVVSRSHDGKPLVCYDCGIFAKTGRNRKQRKDYEQKKLLARQALREKVELKDMTAEA